MSLKGDWRPPYGDRLGYAQALIVLCVTCACSVGSQDVHPLAEAETAAKSAVSKGRFSDAVGLLQTCATIERALSSGG
jgi:hypothetical protein